MDNTVNYVSVCAGAASVSDDITQMVKRCKSHVNALVKQDDYASAAETAASYIVVLSKVRCNMEVF